MRKLIQIAAVVVVVTGGGLIVWERTTSGGGRRGENELPLSATSGATLARATSEAQPAALAPLMTVEERSSEAESKPLTGNASDPRANRDMPRPLAVSSSLWVEKGSDACVGAWGFVSPQPHKDFEAWSCKAVASMMQQIGMAPKEHEDAWAEDMEYGLNSYLSSEEIPPEVERYGIRCSSEGCIVLFEGVGEAVHDLAGHVHNAMHLQPWREDLRFIGFWWTKLHPVRGTERESAIVVLLRKPT